VDVGIGLPNTIVGTTGSQLLDWSRRAERSGFSSLASIGALSYPGYEELTAFAAAAAVTERIRFLTNVLIAPVRSTAELAKQAATVDQISGGRLSLGLGPGWRPSDYVLSGRDFETRGAAFDLQLADLKRTWAGESLDPEARSSSPAPVQNPIPILIGGTTKAAVRRVVEHGVGWTAGGMPPDAVAEFVKTVGDAWTAAGREGSPKIVALVYFSLGDVEQRSREYLLDYYAPMGPEVSGMIADGALRSAEAIKAALAAYEQAGVGELILDPSVGDPDQVDALADVVFG
jgi:alkanesulfonate monooxygenase SsuD/methylene tetrahydromethanopterin reductase-like flavin-dependent oxidoreductase (luciferase family)